MPAGRRPTHLRNSARGRYDGRQRGIGGGFDDADRGATRGSVELSLSIVPAPSLTDLVAQVADRLGGLRDDPFAPDYVIVPSAGVREYLVEHVPRAGGACPVLANVEFIYPGRFNALALEIGRAHV